MFRRRNSSFSRKGPREPKMWDRFGAATLNGQNIFGAPQTVVLWDPSTVIAGNQDLRLTLMRMMVDGKITVTLTGGANPSAHTVSMGIYMGSAGDVRDPSLPAGLDAKTDWLWIKHSVVQQGTASPILAIADQALTRNLQNQNGLLDIRTKRKVDQEENIIFSIRFNDALSTVSTATAQVELWSSVLYQRTMR